MTARNTPNDEQTRLWNGSAGGAWVDAQDVIERMYEPLERLLADEVTARRPSVVLDVGCGAGSTTVGIARRLGPGGRAIGIDISEPMIAVARSRVERERLPASFVRADAQVYTFEPASVDMIVSRFGVMFFDDPVRAFANLRHAARDGAGLRAIVWRSAAENPFMTTAERAAAPLLPNLPPRRPDAPGQFGFANTDRVRAILEDSGWSEIEISPLDVPCSLPAAELNRYVSRFGPVGMLLSDADAGTRARVVEAILPAFDRYVDGADVRYTAACWLIAAQARRGR